MQRAGNLQILIRQQFECAAAMFFDIKSQFSNFVYQLEHFSCCAIALPNMPNIYIDFCENVLL